MRRRIGLWLFIVSVIAVLIAYRYWVQTYKATPVEVAKVRRKPITLAFTADGVVKGKTVDIAPKVMGRVMAISVVEGQVVKKGQLLLQLDNREAQAGVQEAEAALQAARAALRQAEAALALSRQQASAREAQAKAEVNAAQAQLQQVLAGARPQEIAQAEQQVNLAKANLDASEKTLERLRKLHQEGALPPSELDQAEANYKSALAQYHAAGEALDLLKSGTRVEEKAAARARLEAAKAQLESAKSLSSEVLLRQAEIRAARARVAQAKATLEGARLLLSSSTLQSPLNGVVSRIPVEVGELVSPGLPVLTLVETRNLWVEADISDEDAAKVRPSQKVFVTVPAYPGRRFRGKVIELAPQAELKPDVALRTRIVRAKVKLLEGANLMKPGLEVDIEGEGTMVKDALVVPSDALLFRENQNRVFIVEKERAHLRTLRVGYYTYALTEVLEGLKEGDLVVVNGKDQLEEGGRVQVKRIIDF